MKNYSWLVCLLLPLLTANARADPPTKNSKAKNIPFLPTPKEILKVNLFRPFNQGGTLGDYKFRQLIGSAKLLTPKQTEEKNKTFHFAPWYMGSFTTKRGEYTFELYLAGLGKLKPPGKPERMFAFDPYKYQR